MPFFKLTKTRFLFSGDYIIMINSVPISILIPLNVAVTVPLRQGVEHQHHGHLLKGRLKLYKLLEHIVK